MTMNPTDRFRRHRDALSQGAIREHWMLFLIEGIILVILGIAAIVVPPIATIAFTIIIGWLFLICGGVGLVDDILHAERARLLVGAALRRHRHRSRASCCWSGRSPERCR